MTYQLTFNRAEFQTFADKLNLAQSDAESIWYNLQQIVLIETVSDRFLYYENYVKVINEIFNLPFKASVLLKRCAFGVFGTTLADFFPHNHSIPETIVIDHRVKIISFSTVDNYRQSQPEEVKALTHDFIRHLYY